MTPEAGIRSVKGAAEGSRDSRIKIAKGVSQWFVWGNAKLGHTSNER
ncbi:MAG TPA: hypothetical protein VJ719_07445 [Chthoniobacterales bacterium]|nr:hypothetical protein [Chthoniobacterales bacterium]